MVFANPKLILHQGMKLLEDQVDLVIPVNDEGYTEPFHSFLLRSKCLPAMLETIDEGKIKPIDYFDKIKVAKQTIVESVLSSPRSLFFVNINNAEALQKYEKISLEKDAEYRYDVGAQP